MDSLSPLSTFAIGASGLLLLTLLWLRLRSREHQRRQRGREALDTVTAWPPESVRVLSIAEREAYDLLRRSMPGFLIMAQVPLSRFIRVPSRHSYSDWLQRVGSLNADLLLCDAGSRVLAVIDVRTAQDSERSRRRHQRMARVLRAANITVHEWREGQLPSVAQVRQAMASLLAAAPAVAAPANRATSSRPVPLTPLPEVEHLLADGDRAAFEAAMDAAHEPVPSAFFEEMEHPAAAR